MIGIILRKGVLVLLLSSMFFRSVYSQKTIHVFVALCDNANQGIVPVPTSIGNGQDPKSNLYWGAMYGVKTFFKRNVKEWKLIKSLGKQNEVVLDRLLYKHVNKDVYLLCDAYNGAKMENCLNDFLNGLDGGFEVSVTVESEVISFGGESDLLAFVGHNGLMDVQVNYTGKNNGVDKDAIMLCCYSKSYFNSYLEQIGSKPFVWTTHLMAPEAYVLHASITAWLNNESPSATRERVAQAYNKYQKCGMRGARGLFRRGWN